jgi:hypothetical protein
LPNEELEKWRSETSSQYLKTAIDEEMNRRYWNDQSDIVPQALQ